MFKTNYFINFQRLTGQHIASWLFSVSSHKICDCTGMLRAVGSQAGEEDSSAFLNFSKTMTFSRKSIHKKLTAFIYCSYALFYGNNKEKQHEKSSPMLRAGP